MFRSRLHAADQLTEALAEYRGQHPLVLAVPRGAVPMGAVIADALGGDLDVVLVHKLGAPGNPEFAIGAVSEDGTSEVAPVAEEFGIDDEYVKEEVARQLETLRERRRTYTPIRAPIDPSGRIVIVVDDGVATGATMMAALGFVRRRNPAKLIAAIAVSPRDTLQKLRAMADDVVCLASPSYFRAVGEFFADFDQVSDSEVKTILAESDAGA